MVPGGTSGGPWAYRHDLVRATGAGGLLLAVLLATLLGVSTSARASSRAHPGPVDVLYAGSLLDVMQQKIGPAFHRATGDTLVGIAGGSSALSSEIKGGTEVGDVFLSASAQVDTTLEGAANGQWVSTYRDFGESRLVLGYNPHSPFAPLLRREPWFDVVDRPGFLLGRTDPTTDPKGVLAVDALRGVALSFDRPALASLAASRSNVFDETALVGELQAGQLDAGFFYQVEASAAHLATVPLTDTALFAQFTVAKLRHAPHGAAATAFINFLLGPTGRSLLRSDAITPTPTSRATH